ncbi:NAD(P)/FAD-dependent oxidoreductase [Rhizobium sp. 2MFCol3.1]|uniref:flavin-containing monooxygenase n=1 Tax=Rhizobium sp. 2MFCol3.1 TaxID=1246459 RepID=UPI0003698CC0|nr:NAD(P)/FAD-dependent oxidoreductase [Rhizobium sp. 2MFCol3.1]
MTRQQRTQVLIVGSGGNAMSVAVGLQEAGITDYRIITKHGDFGGAWYQNTYPGCAVDGPISVYQFSFAMSPEWPRLYATQAELLDYMKDVASRFDLYSHTQFETEMLSAEWLEDELCWSVDTTEGVVLAEALVLATGFLEEMVYPDIPGMHSFAGKIFHSSLWPEGYTAEGDRVAVVGTGSSSLQIVPAMQKVASELKVFQRTPAWIFPKKEQVFTEEDKARFREQPELLAQMRKQVFDESEEDWRTVYLLEDLAASDTAQAAAQRYLEEQVPDPALRALLTPSHRIGCKRPGVSDDYYRSLQQPNVELVAEAASEITANQIVSRSGRRFDVDTIVLATGFYFGGHILHHVKRRDGVSVGEYQAGHPRAYKAVSVSGCPNLFLIGGAAPNGQNWNGLAVGEIGGGYVVKALTYMRKHSIRAIEVREDAELAWKRDADVILDRSPQVSAGCLNYSLDERGHNKAAWPGTETDMREQLGHFDPGAYQVVEKKLTPVPAPAL